MDSSFSMDKARIHCQTREKDKKRGGSQKTLAQNFSPQLLFVDKELRKNSMLQRRRLIQSIDR